MSRVICSEDTLKLAKGLRKGMLYAIANDAFEEILADRQQELSPQEKEVFTQDFVQRLVAQRSRISVVERARAARSRKIKSAKTNDGRRLNRLPTGTLPKGKPPY